MNDDRPLHVQVAEALGWADMCPRSDGVWGGKAPGVSEPWAVPPHYDTDWAATGPLVEKYGISVERIQHDELEWEASIGCLDHCEKHPYRGANGSTPLIAVCSLILDKHKSYPTCGCTPYQRNT